MAQCKFADIIEAASVGALAMGGPDVQAGPAGAGLIDEFAATTSTRT
jgi:hypothetical protein